MRRLEYVLFGLLAMAGLMAMFLPNTTAFKHVIDEEELLNAVNQEGRYISTDEIAQAIMENDPSILLVDVRTPAEYEKYSLNNAVNIPFDKILEEEHEAYFNQEVYTTVLFSNGSSLADQAWLQLRSYDYRGNNVLKGGLNEWYKTIINPQEPKDMLLSAEEEELYLFRKGASIFFTGVQVVGVETKSTPPKISIKPIIKRKKKAVSGGCG